MISDRSAMTISAAWVSVFALAFGLLGCNTEPDVDRQSPPDAATASTTDGNAPSDDGVHRNGLSLPQAVTPLTTDGNAHPHTRDDADEDGEKQELRFPDAGPHDGPFGVLGDDRYIEVVTPHDSGVPVLSVYVLKNAGGNPNPVVPVGFPIPAKEITASIERGDDTEEFKLAASPDKRDPAGMSSRFVSDEPGLIRHFQGGAIVVRLVVTIDGEALDCKMQIEHGGHGPIDKEGDGPTHSGHDKLVWHRDDISHKGYTIWLGYHGVHLHAGEPVEPAVSITRDGKPVSNAKVFNSLVAVDGKTVLVAEVPSVYEPPTSDEPAHYAQGKLIVPPQTQSVLIRLRIVLPGDAGEVSYDVPIVIVTC